MGKQNKAKKYRYHNTEQQGIKSEMCSQDAVQSPETPISTTARKLMESLASPNTETRICACASIASFASETYTELVQSGVVRLLGPLLIDANATLRTTALGALRNLSLVGGVYICSEMVKNDVMTPLVTLMQQISKVFETGDESKSKADLEVFEQAVHLLWNLCECDELAVKIFTKQQLYLVLLHAFKSGICDVSLLTVIAQCMYTVADENYEVIEMLRQKDVSETLLKAMSTENKDNQTTLLRVVIAGILCTIAEEGTFKETKTLDDIITFLVTVLQINSTQQLQEIVEILLRIKQYESPALNMEAENPKDAIKGNGLDEEAPASEDMKCDDAMQESKEGGQSETNAPKECRKDLRIDLERELDNKLEDVKRVIQAQQTALEIITNLTCPQDEDGEWEDLEESSDTSTDELSMETDNTQSASLVEGRMQVSDDVVKTIILKHNMIDIVLANCKPSYLSSLQNLQSSSLTKSTAESLARLRCCALVCLSNMVGVLDEDILKGSSIDVGNALFQIWAQLGEILNGAVSSSPPDGDTAEASSSALRAVVDKLLDFSSDKVQSVSEADLRFLCTTELSCDTPETRVNLIRVVGCIGGALAEEDTPHPHLKGIGEFFCEVCSREQELWVLAECLDCIFDVFGEDHLNGILREIQLVEKLKSMVSSLKSKYQQQRAILGDHLPIVSTAKTNLTRFIKYKSKVMK